MLLVTETSHDCCIKLELVRVTVRCEQEQKRVEGLRHLGRAAGQAKWGHTRKKETQSYQLYFYFHPKSRHDAVGNVTCAGLCNFCSYNEQQKK